MQLQTYLYKVLTVVLIAYNYYKIWVFIHKTYRKYRLKYLLISALIILINSA